MKVTLEPTPEQYEAPINNVKVPVRIWRGQTERGTRIEAYVLTITPVPADEEHAALLGAEVPEFMRPSREVFSIDTSADDEKTKLLVARGEIEAILRKHDICGHFALIGRGRMEVALNLDASWSNLTLVSDNERGQGIRLRSKLAEYQGDKERQRQDLEATTGMVRGLAEVLGMAAMAWMNASDQFDEKTGAEHTPLKFEPKQ